MESSEGTHYGKSQGCIGSHTLSQRGRSSQRHGELRLSGRDPWMVREYHPDKRCWSSRLLIAFQETKAPAPAVLRSCPAFRKRSAASGHSMDDQGPAQYAARRRKGNFRRPDDLSCKQEGRVVRRVPRRAVRSSPFIVV